MHRVAAAAIVVMLLAVARSGAAADRWFATSDGVRLHYIEQAPADGKARGTIVLIPGWTMPAWIWDAQIADFSRNHRVIAFDPRAQGESEAAPDGYEPLRRGEDIADLLRQTSTEPVLLIGWSLGVLDALAYLHTHGDARLAGLVLVDNSVGEDPLPVAERVAHPRLRLVTRAAKMRLFVQGMFIHPQTADYLDRLTVDCLRTPELAAERLLSYPVPRSYWKEAVYATTHPVLYVVRPRFAGQAANLRLHDPTAEAVVMRGVGHALFVDDAPRFDALVQDFIHRRIWP
jgi:microsomal epoxide hydrolase